MKKTKKLWSWLFMYSTFSTITIRTQFFNHNPVTTTAAFTTIGNSIPISSSAKKLRDLITTRSTSSSVSTTTFLTSRPTKTNVKIKHNTLTRYSFREELSMSSLSAPSAADIFGNKNNNREKREMIIHHSPFSSTQQIQEEKEDQDNTETVLIILNRPVYTSSSDRKKKSTTLFEYLWKISSLRICADGGANRLYQSTVGDLNGGRDEDSTTTTMVPDLIIGDLDSVLPRVRSFYESRVTSSSSSSTSDDKNSIEQDKYCKTYRDPDQNCNDLDKSIQAVLNYHYGTGWSENQSSQSLEQRKVRKKKKYRICVYGAFGGRFDQTMASIQALYKWAPYSSSSLSSELETHNENNASVTMDIILYTEETCATLLLPTLSTSSSEEEREHIIHINPKFEGPSCGLIPIGSKCEYVETEGLKWDLSGDLTETEFGGLVSTSNCINGCNIDKDVKKTEIIKVRNSHPLVWTMEMNGFPSSSL